MIAVAPSDEWLVQGSGSVGRALETVRAELGNWMVDRDGHPHRELVERLEQYVDVLQRLLAREDGYTRLRRAVVSEYAVGDLLDALTGLGANPLWILEHGLRFQLRKRRLCRNVEGRRDERRKLVKRLAKAATEAEGLRRQLAGISADAQESGIPMPGDEWAAELVRMGTRLESLAAIWRPRRVTRHTDLALDLSDHVEMTTGNRHDKEVVDLITATGSFGTREWNPSDLEQRRHRRRQHDEPSMRLFIDVMIDDDIRRRRQGVSLSQSVGGD